jgi:regulator of sigma E protease
MADSAAAEAGFKIGDVIRSVDGQPVESFIDVQRIVGVHAGTALNFRVDREGSEISLTATPRSQMRDSIAGQRRMGVLGIAAARDEASLVIKHEGLFGSISFGFAQSWEVLSSSGDFIAGLFSGRASPDQLSGPIGIAKMSGEVAKAGLSALIGFAGLISVSIGFLNLMPVPMLDGGHLVLFIIEAARRRALDQRVTEIIFRVGLGLLLCLTLFSLYVDLR